MSFPHSPPSSPAGHELESKMSFSSANTKSTMPSTSRSTSPAETATTGPWTGNSTLDSSFVMDPFISKDVPETPSALKAEAVPFLPKMGGLGALNATSLPDKPPISTAGTTHLRGKLTTTTVKPIGTIQPPPPAGYLMMLGPAFTTDSDTDFSTSRFVAVHGLPLEWLNNGYLRQWLDATPYFRGLVSHKLVPCKDDTLAIYCWFNDLREVPKCVDLFKSLKSTCLPISIASRAYYEQDHANEVYRGTTPYDGQIEIISTFQGHNTEIDLRTMFDYVHHYALHFGPVRSFAMHRHINDVTVSFRTEYFMLSTTQEALKRAGSEYQVAKHYVAVIHDFVPEGHAYNNLAGSKPKDLSLRRTNGPSGGSLRTAYQMNSSVGPGPGNSGVGLQSVNSGQFHNTPMSPPRSLASHMSRASLGPPRPTPPRFAQTLQYHRSELSQPSTPYLSHMLPRTPSSSQTAYGSVPDTPYTGRLPYRSLRRSDSSNQPQTVDIAKIESGLDVRTTLMIRNVPNRLNWEDFKEILDETSFGEYDFSYLRTDFGNNCNVGYAFVNFTRPEYIIGFFHQRVGHLWPKSNSDKILEVSYATIQGQDCLIQKFRNSSVMHEYPGFRPKLWYTFDSDKMPEDKKVGDEQTFPAADNMSKLTRSLDNAQAIGLYPPRGSRSGGRRRRGQYDRGTPHAIYEETMHSPKQRFPDDGRYTTLGSPFEQRLASRSDLQGQASSPASTRLAAAVNASRARGERGPRVEDRDAQRRDDYSSGDHTRCDYSRADYARDDYMRHSYPRNDYPRDDYPRDDYSGDDAYRHGGGDRYP